MSEFSEKEILPERRPALLIGCGTFGRDVLKRLLSNTVLRGVLPWETSQNGASSNGSRHIPDLAFFWLQEPSQNSEWEADDNDEDDASLEMMLDLYRQIQKIELQESDEQYSFFADTILKAAKDLLSPSRHTGQSLPLGLDVFIIHHPNSSETMGNLDIMLSKAMDRLANNKALLRGVQQASPLNFIQILDFDNYWCESEQGGQLRQAVYNSIQIWNKRRINKQASFGRFYLVDEQTEKALRKPHQRMDEISLFLEFLLFEEQRIGPLEYLYQARANESPVTSFGIRLVERSSGLLSRLAAAYFGISWLDYLVGKEVSGVDIDARSVREKLAPYLPEALENKLGKEALEAKLETSFNRLEKYLKEETSFEYPNWPESVHNAYAQTAKQLEVELAAQVHANIKILTEKYLDKLSDDLRAGIQSDLHESREPVPLGRVIQEISGTMDQLDVAHSEPDVMLSPISITERVMQHVRQLHIAYQNFKDALLNPVGFKLWWVLFTITMALAMTPLTKEALDTIPQPEKTQRFLAAGFEFLQNPYVDNNVTIGIILWLLLILLLTLFSFQKRIRYRIERRKEFWICPQRSRASSLISTALATGGELRKPSEAFLNNLLNDMALSIRTEVRRELSRVLVRLRERRQEIYWLREQLREFLKLYGLSAAIQSDDLQAATQELTNVRHSIEQLEEFEFKLQSNQPTAERFRTMQAELKPFETWGNQFGGYFLYPLKFVDALAAKQPKDLTSMGMNHDAVAEAFKLFLKEQGNELCLSFLWQLQEGIIGTETRYCLLPAHWRTRDVEHVLSEGAGITGNNRIFERKVIAQEENDRAYLLSIRTGIEINCLVENG